MELEVKESKVSPPNLLCLCDEKRADSWKNLTANIDPKDQCNGKKENWQRSENLQEKDSETVCRSKNIDGVGSNSKRNGSQKHWSPDLTDDFKTAQAN